MHVSASLIRSQLLSEVQVKLFHVTRQKYSLVNNYHSLSAQALQTNKRLPYLGLAHVCLEQSISEPQ